MIACFQSLLKNLWSISTMLNFCVICSAIKVIYLIYETLVLTYVWTITYDWYKLLELCLQISKLFDG